MPGRKDGGRGEGGQVLHSWAARLSASPSGRGKCTCPVPLGRSLPFCAAGFGVVGLGIGKSLPGGLCKAGPVVRNGPERGGRTVMFRFSLVSVLRRRARVR